MDNRRYSMRFLCFHRLIGPFIRTESSCRLTFHTNRMLCIIEDVEIHSKFYSQMNAIEREKWINLRFCWWLFAFIVQYSSVFNIQSSFHIAVYLINSFTKASRSQTFIIHTMNVEWSSVVVFFLFYCCFICSLIESTVDLDGILQGTNNVCGVVLLNIK